MLKQTISLNPAKWVHLYGQDLFQYTLARVDSRNDAEDILQETLLSALKGREGFKGEASEKNWLFSILKNKIVDHYRKKARSRNTQSLPDLTNDENSWFNEEGGWYATTRPSDWEFGQTSAEKKELQAIIEQCRDDLKELQRQVFVLRYMEDKDADFICKVLDISPSNYWVLLHRCRLQMRTCVEHYWLKN
jgi:RNA polymerase sigma-70 factor (TIGR02943 family)